MNNIAIVAVAYNRVGCLKRLLQSLEQAFYEESVTLIISVDKSKTDVVESFAEQYVWPHGKKRVIHHKENLGLRRHMLSLGEHFNEFDALVILEDDVTVVPSFMNYTKSCVEKYANDNRIAGISLYNFNINYQTFLPFKASKGDSDVYLMQTAQSWGEVWLKRQWLEFYEWYKHNDTDFNSEKLPPTICKWPTSSWLKYHTRYCIESNKFFVYPYYSLSTNNGDVGENFEHNDTQFQTVLQIFKKASYELPDMDEIYVRYDGYLEPLFLATHLGLDDSEFTCNLNTQKHPSSWKKYLLTQEILPYQVVRSFGLELRPIEANVIFQCQGKGIWLYDTSQRSNPPFKLDSYQRYYYYYGKAFYNALFMMGVSRCFSLLTNLVRYKIKKVIH